MAIHENLEEGEDGEVEEDESLQEVEMLVEAYHPVDGEMESIQCLGHPEIEALYVQSLDGRLEFHSDLVLHLFDLGEDLEFAVAAAYDKVDFLVLKMIRHFSHRMEILGCTKKTFSIIGFTKELGKSPVKKTTIAINFNSCTRDL